jgi:threonine aldolase
MTAIAIDLRSDTVTRPTPAMRRAIADAEVGDDVFGDDPTVKHLEERVADLLGKQAALFVPTGTMANQIALRAQLRPGDEVLIGKDAHCWRFESGALAALAGAQTQVLPGDGRFDAAAVRAGFKPDEPYISPTRVVAVENTHNMAGGVLWDPAALTEVVAAAHQLGMAAHLDGARLWNAAVATGRSERDLAAGFDSVSVCLSKGLGAPVGSVVAGTRDLVKACHRLRKMYGGGMRQAGILAAAGLFAVEHHRGRLADDHANARYLAEALGQVQGIRVDLSRVQTNIVMIELDGVTSAEVADRARPHGLALLGGKGPGMRLVTHLDVDRAACTRAVEIIAGAVRGS